MYMGEGGTIPFMYMLGEKFPKAQFCITGVLGPGSNAHGPNEFLHIPTARKLTLCVADVLAEHAQAVAAPPSERGLDRVAALALGVRHRARYRGDRRAREERRRIDVVRVGVVAVQARVRPAPRG